MPKYIPVEFDLSKGQVESLKRAIKADKPLTLKLKQKQINVKGNRLQLTVNQAKRVQKALDNNTGVQLKLSKTQLKNSMKAGGVLPIIPLLASFGTARKMVQGIQNEVDEGDNNIAREHLNRLQGKKSKAVKPKGFFGDFLDGFKMGFKNPMDSMELLGRLALKKFGKGVDMKIVGMGIQKGQVVAKDDEVDNVAMAENIDAMLHALDTKGNEVVKQGGFSPLLLKVLYTVAREDSKQKRKRGKGYLEPVVQGGFVELASRIFFPKTMKRVDKATHADKMPSLGKLFGFGTQSNPTSLGTQEEGCDCQKKNGGSVMVI